MVVSRDNIMSTKDHDNMIKEAVKWAKSLGYGVVEYHLGTDTGADAIFENRFGEKAILEIVTGGRFKGLFKKTRIREGFEEDEKWDRVPEILGLIVVGDRIENVEKHGTEVDIPKDLFNPPDQKIFAVLARHFDKVIPVLLVSIHH
jgi:hypothetical protein